MSVVIRYQKNWKLEKQFEDSEEDHIRENHDQRAQYFSQIFPLEELSCQIPKLVLNSILRSSLRLFKDKWRDCQVNLDFSVDSLTFEVVFVSRAVALISIPQKLPCYFKTNYILCMFYKKSVRRFLLKHSNNTENAQIYFSEHIDFANCLSWEGRPIKKWFPCKYLPRFSILQNSYLHFSSLFRLYINIYDK